MRAAGASASDFGATGTATAAAEMKPRKLRLRPAAPTEPARMVTSVGKGRRSRRPSGHPARVAARREHARDQRTPHTLDQLARRMCRDAGTVTSRLEAELWASQLLGSFWSERHNLPVEDWDQYALAYGEPLIRRFRSVGGQSAKIALAAIAHVDDGELGVESKRLADELTDVDLPAWLDPDVDAEIVGTAIMREEIFDDGVTVFVEARHHDGEHHTVGIYVDNNLGVIAKDILLADTIEGIATTVRENPDGTGGLITVEPLAPGEARSRIYDALEATDQTLAPPVSDEYAPLRAVALCRADQIAGEYVKVERPDPTRQARSRLLREFLQSPEGSNIDADSDEAFVARLAIDFCADYVDGRPLRWSPVLVELFMVDWLPRKVLSDDDLLVAVPGALDAWIQFAGRKRGIPDWAIGETRAAVTEWTDEMTAEVEHAPATAPAMAFLHAARDANVDLQDPGAVDRFVAVWNEHGGPPQAT